MYACFSSCMYRGHTAQGTTDPTRRYRWIPGIQSIIKYAGIYIYYIHTHRRAYHTQDNTHPPLWDGFSRGVSPKLVVHTTRNGGVGETSRHGVACRRHIAIGVCAHPSCCRENQLGNPSQCVCSLLARVIVRHVYTTGCGTTVYCNIPPLPPTASCSERCVLTVGLFLANYHYNYY